MTIPAEELAALIRTRELLRRIMLREYKRVPRELRQDALACLKHYPYEETMRDRWKSRIEAWERRLSKAREAQKPIPYAGKHEAQG